MLVVNKHLASFAMMLLTVLLSINAYGKEDELVRVGFVHFPPYSIEGGIDISSGKNDTCDYPSYRGYGIDVDFLISVLSKAKLDYQLQFVPQARLALGLDQIGLDVTASVFYSEENNIPKYQYILYDIGGSTTFLAKESIAGDINSFDDIKFHRLGVVRGEYFHDASIDDWVGDKTNKNIMIANDYEHLFKMLELSRVSVIATNDVLGQYMLNRKGLKNVAFTPYSVPYGVEPKQDGIYIAMTKTLKTSLFQRIKTATVQTLRTNKLACIKSVYGVE